MFWIILAHTYYYCAMSITLGLCLRGVDCILALIHADNVIDRVKNFPRHMLNQIIINGSLAVDTFFFLRCKCLGKD